MNYYNNKIDRTLVIDACNFKQGKTYGFNSYLLNLLKYFNHHRFALNFKRIIIACDTTQVKYFQKFNNIEVHGLNCNGYIRRIWVENRLAKIFHITKEDVILFPGNYSALFKHCLHVLVIHDLLYMRKKWMKNRMFRWQRKVFVPRSIQLADLVIAISEWVKKDIITFYPSLSKGKIVSVYNSFDFGKYGNNPSERILKLTRDSYFLVVSADYPHKHVSTVIETFSKYAIHEKNTKLIIIGKMSNERVLQIDKLPNDVKNRVYILKGINDDDLAHLYRNTKAYINATEFEGLGMPLVEALYLGAKVISSNIEVAKEVTDGKAIYFNPNDIDELNHILINIDKYQQPEKSQESIAAKFCEDNTSGRYVELLNQL